jgi:predicted Fe-Mo cluster-binding NifX family protein
MRTGPAADRRDASKNVRLEPMMRYVAIPVEDEHLFPHFGRAREFEVFEVDEASRRVLRRDRFILPAERCCETRIAHLLVHQVDTVVAGGIGAGAAGHLQSHGIELFAGAPTLPSVQLVEMLLTDQLDHGSIGCVGGGRHDGDHDHDEGCDRTHD